MSPVFIFILGLIAVSLIMGLTWKAAININRAGIVDVVWTFSLALLALFYALTLGENTGRISIVMGLLLLWSGRLGFHLIRRVRTEPDDPRYRALMQKWGSRARLELFRFFQYQAVAASLMSLSFLVVLNYDRPLRWLDGLGLLIGLLALAGEALSDDQLKRFKQKRGPSTNPVCRDGLWAYSRHPNYFFEWLFWVSFVAMGVGVPQGWMTLIAPASLFYFLRYVSGVPPTEERAVRTKGDAYRAYQEEVSAFFPWFPKKSSIHRTTRVPYQ